MKRRSLFLTQGDPHRIVVQDIVPGTTARIQVRRNPPFWGYTSGAPEAEWVLESASPTELVYALSGEATAALAPGVARYVWEMELILDDEPATVVGGGVVVSPETVKA